MKMQDVIAKLREEAPLLEKCAKAVDVYFERAEGLARDLEHAGSEDGRRVLRNELVKALADFGNEYNQLRCSVETVCLVNAQYREKLGPRTRKPKDAPGQQILPGMEQPSEESPATEAAKAEARIAGGRHG